MHLGKSSSCPFGAWRSAPGTSQAWEPPHILQRRHCCPQVIRGKTACLLGSPQMPSHGAGHMTGARTACSSVGNTGLTRKSPNYLSPLCRHPRRPLHTSTPRLVDCPSSTQGSRFLIQDSPFPEGRFGPQQAWPQRQISVCIAGQCGCCQRHYSFMVTIQISPYAPVAPPLCFRLFLRAMPSLCPLALDSYPSRLPQTARLQVSPLA